jgi:hypothetical protein
MNARPLIAVTALAALLAAGTADAQQRAPDPVPGAAAAPTTAPPAAEARTVAKLKDLTGTVLVSRGDAMIAGTSEQRLPLGTRVVTTAGATVTIDYDRGCDVRLKENQRFTVRDGECAALIAAVETLTPGTAAAGGGRTVAGLAGLGLIGAAAAIIAVSDDRGGPNTPAAPATPE